MNPKIGYFFAKVISKVRRDKNKEYINKWFRKKGVNFTGTGHVWINSNIAINEPHLISIGENTTVAGNVEFVTHDNSISKVIPNATDLYGEIRIGNNCFIGARSVLMYGVTIADNVIIAAGSVVTKSVNQNNVIVAGNPAKIVSSWDRFAEKSGEYIWNLNEITREEMIRRTTEGEKLIKK